MIKQIRQRESRLLGKIDQFINQTYDERVILSAWISFLDLTEEEFNGAPDFNEFPEAANMFNVWRMLHWKPDEYDDSQLEYSLPDNVLALEYLQKRPIDIKDRDFLMAAIVAPFCFYQIVSVETGRSMVVKNLLTDESTTVCENLGAIPENVGLMLFSTLVNYNKTHFLLGTGSYFFAEDDIIEILQFKQGVANNHGAWTVQLIEQLETLLLDYYWTFRQALFNPKTSGAINNDGEAFEIHELTYLLSCTAEQAFDALKGLVNDWPDEHFKDLKVFDKHQQLHKVEFPWLKPTDDENEPAQALGYVIIKGDLLAVTANSRERVFRVKQLIASMLDETQAQLVGDEIVESDDDVFQPSTVDEMPTFTTAKESADDPQVAKVLKLVQPKDRRD